MDFFINALKAILFGVIEGITEWLPISSTGHLLIAEEFLGFGTRYGQGFSNLFIVVIQFGAILAVIMAFFKKIWPFGKLKSPEEKRKIWTLILNVVIACVPAVIAGFFLDDIMDQYLSTAFIISMTLIIYGVIFIVAEIYRNKNRDASQSYKELIDITWKSALIIGLAQVLALIPGTSRSGVTIIAALLIGFSRSSAAEFSFIVSIPMIVGASGFKLLKFIANDGIDTITAGLEIEAFAMLLIGIIVSFIVSVFTIKYFMKFIKSKTFIGFGYYRIALGLVILLLGLIQVFPLFTPDVELSLLDISHYLLKTRVSLR